MIHIPPLTITGTDLTAKVTRSIYSDRDFEKLEFMVKIEDEDVFTLKWYSSRWNVTILYPTNLDKSMGQEMPYFTTDEIVIVIDELQKHIAKEWRFYLSHKLPTNFSVEWKFEEWDGVNRVI